jgi:hypothetical protein
MSVELEAIAGVAIGVGKNASLFEEARKLGDRTSRPVTLPGSYQGSGTTYGFLSFPPCTPGKIWEVLRIGATGVDPFTTLAGVTMLAFRSSFVPQDSNAEPATFGDLLAVLGSVPNTSYPSWRSTVVRQQERVILAFKGVTLAQQIQASIDVIEHDLQAYLCGLIGS